MRAFIDVLIIVQFERVENLTHEFFEHNGIVDGL
jgi:hypothetical protein